MSVPKTQSQTPVRDTAIDSTNSTPSPEMTPRRSKTRKPPSVRTKERLGKENKPVGPLPQLHTPPTVSTVAGQVGPEQDTLQLIVNDFQSAIQTRNWEGLGSLVEHYSYRGLHFEYDDNSNHPALKKMRDESAIQVLTANSYVSDEQMNAALDLLVMGADWNAQDKTGTTVLNILRKNMTTQILTLIVDEYPRFKHLFIDRDGQLIPPKS